MSDTITAPDGVREAAGQEEAELSGRTARLAEAEQKEQQELNRAGGNVDKVHDELVIITTLAQTGEAVDNWEYVEEFFDIKGGYTAASTLAHFIGAVRSMSPEQRVEALGSLALAVADVSNWGYWVGVAVAKKLVDLEPTEDDYQAIYYASADSHDSFRRTWTLFVDRANELAVEQDWCGEYERVIESIESRLATPNLTTPSRMVRSEVAITWTVTYSTSVTVEHHPNEYASDAAEERGLTRVEEHFDLPVGYDNIDVEVDVW